VSYNAACEVGARARSPVICRIRAFANAAAGGPSKNTIGVIPVWPFGSESALNQSTGRGFKNEYRCLFPRRKFAQLLGIGAATVVRVGPPSFFRTSPTQSVTHTFKPKRGSIVRLSANENPYGPCPESIGRRSQSPSASPARYPDEHNNVLIDKLAKLNNVDRKPNPAGRRLRGDSQAMRGNIYRGPQVNGKLVAGLDPLFEADTE